MVFRLWIVNLKFFLRKLSTFCLCVCLVLPGIARCRNSMRWASTWPVSIQVPAASAALYLVLNAVKRSSLIDSSLSHSLSLCSGFKLGSLVESEPESGPCSVRTQSAVSPVSGSHESTMALNLHCSICALSVQVSVHNFEPGAWPLTGCPFESPFGPWARWRGQEHDVGPARANTLIVEEDWTRDFCSDK